MSKNKPTVVVGGKITELKKGPETRFGDGDITAIAEMLIIEKASNGYVLRTIGYDLEEDAMTEVVSVFEDRDELFTELSKLV